MYTTVPSNKPLASAHAGGHGVAYSTSTNVTVKYKKSKLRSLKMAQANGQPFSMKTKVAESFK